MVTRSTSLRKFIRTVVNRLPPYIKNYPSDDQILLEEFRLLLQKCESKVNISRISLSSELESYTHNLRLSEKYLQIAFLWFVAEYFDNANLLLNVANYHAEKYFTYLAKYLRTNLNIKGAFQLIREHTPLKDANWEILQYTCMEPPAEAHCRTGMSVQSWSPDAIPAVPPRLPAQPPPPRLP